MKSKTGESFSRSCRISRAADFTQVFQDNIRVSDDCITLLVGKKNAEQPRLGFAVSKKQLKLAVHRNQIKRLIRESFRRHQHELPKHDVVAMVRSKVKHLSHQQIFERLDILWQIVTKKCEKFWFSPFVFINTLSAHCWVTTAVTRLPVRNTQLKRSTDLAFSKVAGWPLKDYCPVIPGAKVDTIQFLTTIKPKF